MRFLRPLTIAMLGSAALLPLPAWADPASNAPAPAATDTAKPGSPPLTVTGKPAAAETGSREQAMQARRNDRKAFMDARLAGLHAGLQLTTQQQPLWDPVESALRELATSRHAMHKLRREDMDPSAKQKQRGERLVAMGQAIGKLADATVPFVGSLTAEQKGRLPMLLHGVGPRHLVKQAFGIDGGRDHMREGMRDGGGMRDGMRDGEQGWHHRHFADRDGGDRPDFGPRGFDHRDGMGDDRDGWRPRSHGWDREGRADRDGMDDGRFQREDGRSWHHGHNSAPSDDERIGG